MLSQDKINDMSRRMVRAFTGPELHLLDDLLADDFVVWNNVTCQSFERAQAIAFFHSFFPNLNLRYEDVQCIPTTKGWVQQHNTTSDTTAGLPVCMVVTVTGEKISKLEEYLNPVAAGVTPDDLSHG